jgi:16S rRNA U1498 N3-methylase RsmE
MTIRLHIDRTLVEHDEFALSEGAARHAQVRRVQPGDAGVGGGGGRLGQERRRRRLHPQTARSRVA